MLSLHKRSTRSLLAGPVLCALVLAGMAADHSRYDTEQDFEPYHARVAAAVTKLPEQIGSWIGERQELPEPAINLLKPNATYCYKFTDTGVSSLEDRSRSVLLLLVQCKETRDMAGHWPPRCYVAQGDLQTDARSRDWIVQSAAEDGTKIGGMEYQFTRMQNGQYYKTVVYNFIVLPKKGIVRDMKALYQSAEDYKQRYLGAAQFQMVFGGSLAENDEETRRERDEIFGQLMPPMIPVIELVSTTNVVK